MKACIALAKLGKVNRYLLAFTLNKNYASSTQPSNCGFYKHFHFFPYTRILLLKRNPPTNIIICVTRRNNI